MAEPLHNVTSAFDDADEYRPEPEPEPQPAAWCDGSVRIGIHTSIAGDIAGALESARKLGCNALQIFSASPRMWPRAGSRIAEADAARFRARRAELGLGPLVIHANYLINLASSEPVMRVRVDSGVSRRDGARRGARRGLSGGASGVGGWRRRGGGGAERWRRRSGRRRAAFALAMATSTDCSAAGCAF